MNISKMVSVKKKTQTSIKAWTKCHETVENSITERRKRKGELEEYPVAKFKFNKRGKLTSKDVKELSRSKRNIFTWLKPVVSKARQMEPEKQEEV